MDRPLTLLIGAAVLASAPLAAQAQIWPATVVAGAPRMAPQPTSPALSISRSVVVRRAVGLPPTQLQRRALVVVRKPAAPQDLPAIEVRAKEAWLDDEGLRLSPTRVAYKHRF